MSRGVVPKRPIRQPQWAAPKISGAETRPCFVVAGGPSVEQCHVDALRGHDVLVVNSSWTRAPWAKYLFFGDDRWWLEHGPLVAEAFRGLIVTVARHIHHPRLHRIGRASPPGLSTRPSFVTMERTSVAGAINLLTLFGYKTIPVLGVDNRPGPGGAMWHHKKHSWPTRKTWADDQRKELEGAASLLKESGVRVINLSPVSRLDCWERGKLEDFVNVNEQAAEAENNDQRGGDPS